MVGLGQKPEARSCEHCNKLSGFTRDAAFLDQLHDYYVLTMDYAPLSH
jgi:hypothetical protein